MEKKEYLVLGATGKTGRRVVEQLRARGEVVRAARSAELPFEWNDPQTWQSALDGAYGVYIVAPDEPGPAKDFIAAAEKAGVKRAVLLSARGTGKGYLWEAPMLAMEEALKKSSLSWTILHPTNFYQNFDEDYWQSAVPTGRLALPIGDAREALVDVNDIAAVAVAALLEDGHAAKTYPLTGPEALTYSEVAAKLAKASGKPVVFENLTMEAYRQELLGIGYPDFVADIFGDLLKLMQSGENAVVSDSIPEVLGREAISFDEYARQVAATGVWK
ncbi:MAG: NAD(P)H-binding protein [Renibacterium sp.]|nr:NAD(P)H-binding protein [Renibacterium sp.]